MADQGNDRSVNGQRLWSSLMKMAEIGATPAGGSNRQALTEEDRQGRRLFSTWAEAAGCAVHQDAIGNLFATRPGSNPAAAPILIGSHLDTQPTGGRFDGVYGVLAGLEIVRTLNDLGLQTRSPLIVASWTNEEGARFPPAMMGSGVWAGAMDLDRIYQTVDRTGQTLRDALLEIDALGSTPASSIALPIALKGAFELHIEQGPILEAADQTIGIVTGVQGIRWYDLRLTGMPCHAGPTPMEGRRDPVQVLPDLLPPIYRLATDNAPWGRVTIGDIVSQPGSRNTVPESIELSIDLRHPEQTVLDDMHQSLERLVNELSNEAVQIQLTEIWHSPAVAFDSKVLDAIRQAVTITGYSAREMVSGAGHDSVYVARVAPTAMIFIPCREGLSHNEAEYASPEHITSGCNVLLNAVLSLDAR